MTKPNAKDELFEKGDVKAEEEAIGRLVSYAGDLFWGDLAVKLGVDISDVGAMHMGVYRKMRRAKKVKVFPKNAFTIPVRHALVIDNTPLKVEPLDPATQGDGRPYDVIEYQAGDSLSATYLLNWDILGDVAVDDEAELRRAGFPGRFAEALGSMSPEAREVYQDHIDNIRDRPPALSNVKPKKFVQTLAAYGTYQGTSINVGLGMAGGAYFRKWEPGKEGKGPLGVHYTEDMLENSSREVVLKAKQDYLMLKTPNGYRLLQLHERDGELGFTEIIASFDSFHDELPADRRPKHTAVFFHAINGAKEIDAHKRQTYKVTSRGAQRLLLDPRRMVESLVGPKNATAQLGLGEPFDWFVEMVCGYFPSRFYVLDFRGAPLRPDDKPLHGVKGWADEAVNQVLAISNPKDPFFTRLSELRKKEILDLVAQNDVIVLPQGFLMSPRARFVGADHSWCYARDLKTGAVYAMGRNEFVYDLYVGGISQMVYEASAGMIPMLALMFATVAAIPVAIYAGPAAIARYATKEITRKALEELAADLAKRMVPVLVAEMGSMVATIFIYASDDDDPNSEARKWRAFSEGFFKGYLVNTIYDSFFRGVVVKNLAEGIPEYRYYKWARRVYAAIEKVQHTVQLLEEQLDKDSVDKGITLFKKAIGHVGQGVVLLISALYYSDYDEAKVALDVFGAGPDDEPPPDPAHWELEAGAQLAHIAEEIAKELELHDIDDLLETLKTSKALKLGITAAILNPHIWKAIAYTWQNRPFKWKKWDVKYIKPARPAIIMVVIASMVGVLLYLDDQTDGKLFDVAGDLIWGLVSDLPGPTADRARINGELIGNVLGVFAFNSFIHKEPTYANRKKKWASKSTGEKWQTLMDSPFFGTTLQGSMKIGVVLPILKLVFKRYVSLYEDLKRKGVFDLARTDETIGHFLSVVDDAALEHKNLAHLTYFRTEDESAAFSLERLVVILFRLRTMLAKDLQSYLEAAYNVPELKEVLKDDLEAFKKLANDSGLSAAIEKHAHTTYKMLTVQLHAAVSHLEEALKALMTGFTAKNWSWLHLLRELGLDIDIDKAEEAFKREVERLQAFRGSST